MFNVQNLLRNNIRDFHPYSSARDEFQGVASVYLDANENPYETEVNRYPDVLHMEVKAKIGRLKNVFAGQIFLGNGSDEAIDLLIRAFCEPGQDNIVAIKPTYGMYKVCADINGVEYKEILLGKDFNLLADNMLGATNEKTKLMFICSPNNPTGNSLAEADILQLLNRFNGIVVLDEAYIDFAEQKTFLKKLNDYPNLVVLQTFSKAWGMAGIRLGMAFGSSELIKVLNKIKYPYNVNVLSINKALEKLDAPTIVEKQINEIIEERYKLVAELEKLPYVDKVFSTDANFILVRVEDAKAVYHFLLKQEIIVRNRSKVALCEECIRISVGTPVENKQLIQKLKNYKYQ